MREALPGGVFVCFLSIADDPGSRGRALRCSGKGRFHGGKILQLETGDRSVRGRGGLRDRGLRVASMAEDHEGRAGPSSRTEGLRCQTVGRGGRPTRSVSGSQQSGRFGSRQVCRGPVEPTSRHPGQRADGHRRVPQRSAFQAGRYGDGQASDGGVPGSGHESVRRGGIHGGTPSGATGRSRPAASVCASPVVSAQVRPGGCGGQDRHREVSRRDSGLRIHGHDGGGPTGGRGSDVRGLVRRGGDEEPGIRTCLRRQGELPAAPGGQGSGHGRSDEGFGLRSVRQDGSPSCDPGTD